MTLINFIKRYRTNLGAIVAITVLVLLANSFYLLKLANPDPLLQRSGLAISQQKIVLSGLSTIDPNDGFTSQALGNQSARQWLQGHVPFWNHYEGIGTPLAGEMQSQALSPFVLFFAFANGNLIFQIFMEIIAGVATYFFLKRLHIQEGVALIGGMLFALNGTFAWLHNAVFNPVAWLPVLLLGIEIARGNSEAKRRSGWLLMALGLALSIYSGFPETAFINAVFAGIWALLRLASLKKPHRKDFFIKIVLGWGTGLLLAGPILVAFLGYLAHADVGWHNGAIGGATLNQIGIGALLMPYVYGPIFGLIGWSRTTDLVAFWGSVGGYYTVSVAVFAGLGLVSKFPRALKIFLVSWVGISLLKTFGVRGVSDVLNILPIIKNIAFFRYVPPSISFALIILAAMGLESLLARDVKKRHLAFVWGASLAVLGLTVLVAKTAVVNFATAPNHKLWAIGSVALALSILGALWLAILVARQKFVLACLGVIIIGEALVLFIVPQLSTPRVMLDQGPITFLKQNIGFHRFYTLGPIEPNYGSFFDVASINQNDLPVPKSWSDYLVNNLDANTTGLNFTGNYRVDSHGASSKAEFFRNIANYQYIGVKYLVTQRNTVTTEEAATTNLQKVYVNPSIEIFQLPTPGDYFQDISGKCIISSQSRDNLSLNCPSSTSLVRKELYISGWSATANAKPVALSQEASLFQKVQVPAGKTKLEFSYLPPFMEFGVGALMIGLGLVVLSVLPVQKNKLVGKLQSYLS